MSRPVTGSSGRWAWKCPERWSGRFAPPSHARNCRTRSLRWRHARRRDGERSAHYSRSPRRAATTSAGGCGGARNARPSSTRRSRPARPVRSARARGPRGGARSVPCLFRARSRSREALAPVAPARREVPGVHRAGRRSPAHAAHARGRGRAGRHRDRPRGRPVRPARPRRSRSRTTAATAPPGTRPRKRSRRTCPAATTTPSTAPTSRSRRSTSARRRSTACATIRGGGRRRRRPKARSSPGPIASPTCATTSRTRVRAGILAPDDLPEEVAAVVGRSRLPPDRRVRARGARRDRPHRPRRHDRARGRRARRVPGVQLRPDLPAARGARARPRRWSACCSGLVDFFVDAPAAIARGRQRACTPTSRPARSKRPRSPCAT